MLFTEWCRENPIKPTKPMNMAFQAIARAAWMQYRWGNFLERLEAAIFKEEPAP